MVGGFGLALAARPADSKGARGSSARTTVLLPALGVLSLVSQPFCRLLSF